MMVQIGKGFLSVLFFEFLCVASLPFHFRCCNKTTMRCLNAAGSRERLRVPWPAGLTHGLISHPTSCHFHPSACHFPRPRNGLENAQKKNMPENIFGASFGASVNAVDGNDYERDGPASVANKKRKFRQSQKIDRQSWGSMFKIWGSRFGKFGPGGARRVGTWSNQPPKEQEEKAARLLQAITPPSPPPNITFAQMSNAPCSVPKVGLLEQITAILSNCVARKGILDPTYFRSDKQGSLLVFVVRQWLRKLWPPYTKQIIML